MRILSGRLTRLLSVAIIIALTACGGAEDRKAAHMKKGQELFAAENFEKARLEFKNVLQIDPRDVSARYALAQALEQLKSWRPAAGQYLRVIDMDPKHVGARVRLGALYLLSEAPEKAMEMADEALAIDPSHADALVLRGGARARAHDLNGATQDGEAALALEPTHANALSLVATLRARSNNVEGAIELLESGTVASEGSNELKTLLAKLYAGNNENDKAIELLQTMIEREPANYVHSNRLAGFYQSIDSLDEAEKVLREAAARNPSSMPARLSLIEFMANTRGKEEAQAELLTLLEQDAEAYPLWFESARLYEELSDAKKAKESYQNIIEVSGVGRDGLEARNRLALLLAKERDFDGATAVLADVLENNPNDKGALLLRSNIALTSKDPGSAIADLRIVLRNYPDSPEALRLLARAHLLNDDPELARDVLERAVSTNPDDVDPQLDFAKLLVQAGDNLRATQQLHTVLESAADNIEALEALVKIQIGEHDWDSAIQTAERLKAAYPDRAVGSHYMGLTYQKQGQFDASVEELKLALKIEPTRSDSLSALVESYLAQKEPEKALDLVNQALRSESGNVTAQNLVGMVHAFEDNVPAAEAAFRKAIDMDPAQSDAYRNLAKLKHDQGIVDSAIAIYKEGMTATGDITLGFEVAALYEEQGQQDQAIAQYESMLDRDPDALVVVNNLAMLLVTYRQDTESLDRALTLVQRFKSSDNPAYLDTLGWVHHVRGEIDVAIPVLEKAVHYSPHESVYRYHLGMAHASKGNPDLARTHLEKALATNESFQGAEEAMATLNRLRGT